MQWEAISEARRKLAREEGTIIKDWGGRIPVALIYPNTYYVGMSNLGFQTIYGLLNSDDALVCERAFYDDQSMDGTGKPIFSIESQRELSEFAVIAFSLTFELDYFNIIAILRQAKIPLLASERDSRHPILIGGGPCVIQNPEPLAPFFDVMVIGEGEAVTPHLMDVLKESHSEDRDKLLQEIATIPGTYVPALYQVDYNSDGSIAKIRPETVRRTGELPFAPKFPVMRQIVQDIAQFPVHSVVLTPDTELGDMYLIEVSRGCSRGCQFCLAGFVFLPNRERPLEQVLDIAREGLSYRKRIGLVGAATTDYSRISELAVRLREMGAQIGVSSLRMDSLTDDLLKALVESGTKTVTLAPEAGSERMRQLINKRISEEQILHAVDMVGRWKVPKLKLYYMIGLPTENIEDVDEIIRLTAEIKRRMARHRPGIQVTINLSHFVAKAQTPFQRETMMTVEELKNRMTRLRKGLRPEGIEVRTDSAEWAEVQGVLARGDRRIAGVLMTMKRNSLSEWRKGLVESGLSADFYVRRSRDVQEVLPWSFIRSGVSPTLPPISLRKRGENKAS